jgi:hypothetical protein
VDYAAINKAPNLAASVSGRIGDPGSALNKQQAQDRSL